MSCISHPTACLYLIGVKSPEFQLLFEERPTDICWIMKFPYAEKIVKFGLHRCYYSVIQLHKNYGAGPLISAEIQNKVLVTTCSVVVEYFGEYQWVPVEIIFI